MCDCVSVADRNAFKGEKKMIKRKKMKGKEEGRREGRKGGRGGNSLK